MYILGNSIIGKSFSSLLLFKCRFRFAQMICAKELENTRSSYHLCFAYCILSYSFLPYLSTSHNILRCQPQLITCA